MILYQIHPYKQVVIFISVARFLAQYFTHRRYQFFLGELG